MDTQDLLDRHLTHLNRQRNLYKQLTNYGNEIVDEILKLDLDEAEQKVFATLIRDNYLEVLEELSELSHLLADDMTAIGLDFLESMEEFYKGLKNDDIEITLGE